MGGPDWNSKLAEMFAVSTAANACAGAVVVSLSDLIQRYKQDLKRYGRGAGATKDEWASSGECFHSHPAGQAAVTYSVGQAIVAAANHLQALRRMGPGQGEAQWNQTTSVHRGHRRRA